jgi:hypothetical protein
MKKPILFNYVLFSFFVITLLFSFFFPSTHPYYSWLKDGMIPYVGMSSIPEPLLTSIGKALSVYFLLFPLIFTIYFARKLLFLKSTKIFIKLPLFSILLTIIGTFIHLFLVPIYSHGENWSILTPIFFIPIMIIVSFITASITTLFKNKSDVFLEDNINHYNYPVIIICFFFSVICLSCSYNYNLSCNLQGVAYYDLKYCWDYKNYSEYEKDFFSYFPKMLNGLVREDTKGYYLGTVSFGHIFPIQVPEYFRTYTLTYYSFDYKYGGLIKRNISDGIDIIVSFIKNTKDMETIISRNKIGTKEMINNNNLLSITEYSTQYYSWLNNKDNVIVQVTTSPDNVNNLEIIKLLLNKYPSTM